jgi:hypothetical protein
LKYGAMPLLIISMVDILDTKNIIKDPLRSLTYDEIFQPDQSVFTGAGGGGGSSENPTSSQSGSPKTNTVTEGTLRVVDGYIGGAQGWIIRAGLLQSEGIGLATVKGDPTWAFWAGNDNPASAEFRVSHTGDLVATSATITGSITATSGRIANWYINTNTLSSGAVESSSNVLIDSLNSLLRLGPTSGNYITLDGANLRIRSSNYNPGVAGFTVEPTLIEAENLVARATLKGATFQYDVISAVGGQLIVANADTLLSDMTALDAATLPTKGTSTFAANDILLIRAITANGIQEEWMRVAPVTTTEDSYSESNQSSTISFSGGLTNKALAQSFTASHGGALTSCKFYLRKSGSPTGNITAKLYAHSGSYGTSSLPSGAALAASATVDISTLTTSLALVTFTFSGVNQYTLVNGTRYCISVEYSGGDASNFLTGGIDSTSSTHGGNQASQNTGTSAWSANATFDLAFYVYSDGVVNPYTVTRDLASTYSADSNPAWQAGTTIVKQGKSDGSSVYSGGWLRLLGEGTNSPHYSVFSRTGLTYNSYSERVRVGNLNGIGGKVADTYGFFAGNYSAGKYLMYDDVSGDLIVNDSVISNNDLYGDGSDGDVTISVDTTLTSDMFYNSLTINTTKTLNPGGFRIFVKTTLTYQGTGKISVAGGAGGAGSNATPGTSSSNGGAGGTAGAAKYTADGTLPKAYDGAAGGGGGSGGGTDCVTSPTNGTGGSVGGANIAKALSGAGSAGGNGGQSSSANCTIGSGSAGRTVSGTIFNKINNGISAYNLFDVYPSFAAFTNAGASGSGGGGEGGRTGVGGHFGGGGGGGGGSGATGGVVSLFARKIVTVDGNTYLDASGGNGGNGGNGGDATAAEPTGRYGGGGGGGAGGRGGTIILVYSSKSGTGTTSIAGGTGGTKGLKGDATAGNATNGTAGGTGVKIELVI